MFQTPIKVNSLVERLIQFFSIDMSKFLLIFLIFFVFFIFFVAYSGDYSKQLGGGYTIERTNACCIYISNENAPWIEKGNLTYREYRIIKPKVKKIWFNNKIIVGYKEKNECCYLSKEEVENPDGYFILDKHGNTFWDGLSKSAFEKKLNKYSLKLEVIDFNILN
jgi:hypothetical protein